MPAVTAFLERRLKLKVNATQSGVAHPGNGSSWLQHDVAPETETNTRERPEFRSPSCSSAPNSDSMSNLDQHWAQWLC